ncbi:hypothetical protein Ancab_017100 [Ancistrocladus abbreviatus]
MKLARDFILSSSDNSPVGLEVANAVKIKLVGPETLTEDGQTIEGVGLGFINSTGIKSNGVKNCNDGLGPVEEDTSHNSCSLKNVLKGNDENTESSNNGIEVQLSNKGVLANSIFDADIVNMNGSNEGAITSDGERSCDDGEIKEDRKAKDIWAILLQLGVVSEVEETEMLEKIKEMESRDASLMRLNERNLQQRGGDGAL